MAQETVYLKLEKDVEIDSEDVFVKDMEESFSHKFARKPEMLEGNMNALKMALKEVK